MYLSTISAKDASPVSKLRNKPTCSSLETADIEGAKPLLKGYQYFNKPSYSNSTELIEKSSPRHLHQEMQKPNYNLNTRDIEKAFPEKTGFQSKRIGTNPLNPVYQLSKYTIKTPTPPKFIRDHINVSDIQGTRPDISNKWSVRDTIGVADIEGAQPRPTKDFKKPDLTDPRDINRGETKSLSRMTNPLMPEYVGRADDGSVIRFGNILGSSPKVSVDIAKDPHKRHLDNRDIDGSTAGTVGLTAVGSKERNYQKPLVNAADIEGACSGSLKKGISTLRTTNPLMPSYVWKTEEIPENAPAKPSQPPPPIDPKYNTNIAKFYGATPAPSEKNSPPRTHSSSRQSDFHRNANHFFAPDALTADTLNRAYNNNVQKFFESSGAKGPIANFQALHAPGSIHKPKPNSKYVDLDSAEYLKNTNKFFSISQSRSQKSENSETNSLGSASSLRRNRANFEENEGGNYKFALARAEIAKPQEGEERMKSSNEERLRTSKSYKVVSDKNILSSVAKSIFN